MKRLRIYFEGDPALREGFRKFFHGLNRDVTFIALRSNWNKFEQARIDHPNDECVLLRDSEGPAPKQAAKDQFFMVQMMESWFLADTEAAAAYFGKGFQASSLPKSIDVEAVSKDRVLKALSAATRGTAKKDYFENKLRHANALLKAVDPAKVRKAAKHCERIFAKLASG